MLQQGALDRRIFDLLLPIVAMFVASRGVLLLIAQLTATQIAPDPQALDQTWTSYLCRFDCAWYLSISQHGYSPVEATDQPGATNFAFYPLFPLLIRYLAPLFGGNHLYAAIAVANACFLAALIYVYRYARLLGLDHRVALLAVGLLCVLPQSIAFSAAYSESPFLLLLVVAMYYVRLESYLAAGIAAALLSATRANGIFFAIFCLMWTVQQAGPRAFLQPWREPERFVPVVLAPLGFFLFLGYCFMTTGDAFAHPSTEEVGWGWHFGLPWENLSVRLRLDGLARISTLLSIGVFACSLLLIRLKLYAEVVLCAALTLLIWSGNGAESLFRYWLVLFPVWIAVAGTLAQRPIISAIALSTLSMVNGLMMCAWTLQKPIAI